MSRRDAATKRAVLARDAGLRRISRVTRWLIAGAVSLSGALALIAANAFHGHTLPSNSASSSQQQAPTTQQQQPSVSSSEGPAAPQQAPVQTPAQPVVVSGGS